MPAINTGTPDIFKSIIEELLLPLFPGATCDKSINISASKRNSQKPVTQAENKSTLLKLQCQTYKNRRCQIRRTQPFQPEEKKIIECFLTKIPRLYESWNSPYKQDTISSVMSEFVATSVSDEKHEIIQYVISIFSEWAQQTYEGQRIAHSIGITSHPTSFAANNSSSIKKLSNNDFLKVLSNGHDTILCLTSKGKIQKHLSLTPPTDTSAGYYPIRYAALAEWTKDNDNIVATLNRNGEILLFKDGNICFAKRRGKWRYFAHESLLRQITNGALGKKTPLDLRREIYLTALDISFSRTGGCIGVVNGSKLKELRDGLHDGPAIDDSDFMPYEDLSPKAKALKRLTKGKTFQSSNRLLRIELIAIDGATVINHKGEFLAIGAILRVSGGSTGGGRHLAAQTIAEYGLGIKISNDGYIEFFNKQKETIAKLS